MGKPSRNFINFSTLVCFLLLLAGCGNNGTTGPANASPTIAAIFPLSAQAGTTVTITGTNFSTTLASNTVAFNGTVAVVTNCTSTQIVTTVPSGATTGPITVTSGRNHVTSTASFAVLPPSGTLDPSFGSGGVVLTSVDGMQAVARALGIQQDGKIVAAGGSYSVSTGVYTNENMIVARFNPDGSSDNSFGAGGKVTLSVNSGAQATALAVQPDGKIVVGGFACFSPGVYDFLVVRLNPDGTLDQGFGTGGVVITPIAPHPAASYAPISVWGSKAYELVLQADGKIIVGGDTFTGWVNGPGPDNSLSTGYALARYNTDGSLDTSFGLNGSVLGARDQFSGIGTVVIQPDGKLVAGGGSSDGGGDTSFIARYNTDGTPDTTFGSNGVVNGVAVSGFASVALQSDGMIVASDGSGLTRYQGDGSIDTSFGNGGKATAAGAIAILLQSDGKIVLAFSVENIPQDTTWYGTPPTSIALERYNSDGSPDENFGSAGAIMNVIGDGFNNSEVYAITSQLDGKFVIVGTSTNNQGNDAFTVVRCFK